ncbi:CYTH domain-containing protein [Anaerocolumna xylanovorans]|uniref:Uncharacterized protein YjbK n=1 Tax=Anaerocolumna xylanovorans DSM 12503 TaxID=1121345 RepID=A0A1M7XWZ8_9FIRM|nr:CYTH domain-containing protein [Anaerocolumna xylanovorans]SHO43139.1 Uncharacterized protein YjbK [Anaerocolumna xylanovorans DSM 12503]
MIEKELKIKISQQQYDLVKDLFNWDSKVVQTNFYYGDLNTVEINSEMTIRIREISNKRLLQIKKPIAYDKSIHIKEEFEKIVDSIPLSISKEELKEIAGVDMPDVSLLGKLETLRFTSNWDDKTEVCLDKSQYFDCIDYEIEIEYQDELPEEILTILSKNCITLADKVYGKFARFMRAYLKKLHENK